MIIKDILQIDRLAEQMFGQTDSYIRIDQRDYNRLKTISAVLNATSVKLPLNDKAAINQFIDAINDFGPVEAHDLLLQICVPIGCLDTPNITINEVNMILSIINEHFGKISTIWGLSECDEVASDSYEVRVIVGYGSPFKE